MLKTTIFTKKQEAMADNNSEGNYFDESTSILAPVYIIIALGITFGVLFFG